MVAIMNRSKLGKNYLFLKLNIVVTEDLNPVKLDSTFLIVLYHLEGFIYVTTAVCPHSENKMHKSGTEVHLHFICWERENKGGSPCGDSSHNKIINKMLAWWQQL